jgi:archaemetzincin
VPNIGKEVAFMRDWITPAIESPTQESPSSPDVQLFVDYLKAFYHGMKVQTLETQLQWTTWDKASQPRRKAALPKYVALQHDDVRTRIRVRKTPDGAFPAQLNLDDIIDVAIAILPSDAYALMLLVDHDIHEDEDDDFCCGRAYGGSRVAVVQTARYNPALDVREKIDHTHMWPLSHCKTFVDDLCAVEDVVPKKPTKSQILGSKFGPMRMAVDAATARASSPNEVRYISALWFSRLARTVSHEVGHCFGIAHCVYYACNMQGTAGMKEDVRQPPYLCPICEAKVGHAIAGELLSGGMEEKQRWTRKRCETLRLFCTELQQSDNDASMWRGLDAWLEARLKAL